MGNASERMKRRWLYLPYAFAGIVLFAYFALWSAGAAEMKKAVHAWADDQRNAGFEISHGAIRAEGFPFFLRVHIDTPDITSPDEWRWRTGRLTLDALPYDLNRLIFSIRSEQTLSAGNYGEWRISAQDWRASIARDKIRGWKFASTLGGVNALRTSDKAEVHFGEVILDLAPAANDADAAANLMLNLAASAIAASFGERALRLDSFQTMMTVTEVDAIDSPRVWRRAGGELDITALMASLDTSTVSVSGRLSLDENMYPKGRLQTRWTKPAPLVLAMGEASILEMKTAERAAAALTLTAIAGGGKISAPLELKGGGAHLAGVRLASLPKVQ